MLLLSWIVTNLLLYAVTNFIWEMGMEIPEIYFQSLNCAFMRIQAGCQGRQRRLFSLDNQPEYAYTLAAIDKLESKK